MERRFNGGHASPVIDFRAAEQARRRERRVYEAWTGREIKREAWAR